MATIKTTFQFRRGESSAWEKNNPILAYGEPGFEKNTNRLKIGDGVTPWNELDYFKGDEEALNAALALKANIADVYTKAEVDSKDDALRQLISEQIHFTTKIVTSELDVVDPGTLYLIKDVTAIGSDIYEEYILVDGVVTKIGTTETDLTNYYTKEETDTQIEQIFFDLNGDVTTAELLNQFNSYTEITDQRIEKLEQAKANSNVIESVQINGIDLPVDENKAVNIPIGGESLGVVKSSTEDNQVSIDAEGNMEVNSIHLEKIVQSPNTRLILYGGSASINI